MTSHRTGVYVKPLYLKKEKTNAVKKNPVDSQKLFIKYILTRGGTAGGGRGESGFFGLISKN